MDYTATYEAYMMFRMTEAEHVAQSVPKSVAAPKVSDYDRYILDASAVYDAELYATYNHVDERG